MTYAIIAFVIILGIIMAVALHKLATGPKKGVMVVLGSALVLPIITWLIFSNGEIAITWSLTEKVIVLDGNVIMVISFSIVAIIAAVALRFYYAKK